jgi:hypothetical protein
MAMQTIYVVTTYDLNNPYHDLSFPCETLSAAFQQVQKLIEKHLKEVPELCSQNYEDYMNLKDAWEKPVDHSYDDVCLLCKRWNDLGTTLDITVGYPVVLEEYNGSNVPEFLFRWEEV